MYTGESEPEAAVAGDVAAAGDVLAVAHAPTYAARVRW